jgi:hypothetical protein
MTGGAPLTVTLGKRKEEAVAVVDAVIAAKLKKRLDLSNNDTRKALSILRKGKVKVEPKVMDVIEEVGAELEDEYETIKMMFEVNVDDEEDEAGAKKKKKKKKQKKKEVELKEVDVAIVKDSLRLVEKVIEARGLCRDSVMCRAVIDGGQGSLKVCLSVFDSDQDPEISFSMQEGPGEKLTGVNRLLILAEVEGGLERHQNVRLLLDHLQLERLPGNVMIGDLCITNCYCGISKHGGKFACYVCEGESTLKSGVLRTFGSLDRWNLLYVAAGSGNISYFLLLIPYSFFSLSHIPSPHPIFLLLLLQTQKRCSSSRTW